MLQTLNFSGARQVNAKASFFRYESGSAGGADESIRVRADGNDLGTFLPGDYLKLPFEASCWELVPVTPAAAGVVRLGLGEVGSARLVGNVRVIDGERDKVLAGVCYRSYAQVTGANKAAIQLWNPAGSARNLFVQAVRAGAVTADSWQIQTSDNALSGAGPAPANLDRAGVSSVAQTRTGVATELTNVRDHAAGYIQASQDAIVLMPRPVLLRPGSGLTFFVNAASNTLRACFEWEEWPI